MNDKMLHFMAGLALGAVARGLLGQGAGFIASVIAGAGKEGWDWLTGGDVSMGDFAATVAGGVAAEAGFHVGEL